MQLPMRGLICLEHGCHGRMKQEYDESLLYNQLKYFETLFDLQHFCMKKNIPKAE
jgi:hypothetical protein